MAFKARQLKGELFDIHGLEDFVERKVHEVMQALGQSRTAGPAKATKASKEAKRGNAAKAASAGPGEALEVVLASLEASGQKAALIKAGKQKDQLLRSLIPLYLTQRTPVEVSSGVTSRFWARFGVTYAAPNAAKALREHPGYARRTRVGNRITPNGVKYVDAALAGAKR
ncbi:MAG: hypothetical protein INH37_10390 [Myxococcaceae bacterium]|nr:hypothetical protein [Myxococcaceae bacterium]